MALAIDASTPVVFSTTTTLAITSASFTPPAGALLLVLFGTNGAAAADASVASITNTGTALTWSRLARKNRNAGSTGGTAGQNGGVEIWSAVVGTSAAMTVTITGSATAQNHTGKVMVLTGADTASLTNVAAAAAATGPPTASVPGCSVGSYVFAANGDWNGSGVATVGTGQTVIDTSALQMNITFWRTTSTLASAGSQTMNITAPSSQIWNLAAIEVKAAGGAVAANPQRTRMVRQAVNRAGSF